MKRLAVLLLLAIAATPAVGASFVQAVEFPYYLYPHQLWERELVWLKNIGVQTVEFSIPWNYHQTASGEFDLTGATGPRRDLTGFIRLLRKLGLHAWVRP
ncbi:MAG: glycoside hydrolase, family 35, partial [Candidatus Solibacter sp.]|nr:glycoside hydrolase, family 35 [Candidatus Solibacter sp.]